MEKISRNFIISIILNIVLLAGIGIYVCNGLYSSKDSSDRIKDGLQEQRNTVIEIENTNRELGQNIEGISNISNGLEKTSGRIRDIQQGLENTNREFGEGINGLREICDQLELDNRDDISRISEIEKIFKNVENNR